LEGLSGDFAILRGTAERLNLQITEKSKSLEIKMDTLEKEQAHSQWLQNEWDAAKHKIDELNQSNHKWWSMSDRQSKELVDAGAKIDELNHSSHHWWTVADSLSHEQQSMRNSNSWRMTWPLRKVMQFFVWLFTLPIFITVFCFSLPRRSARWLLVRLMAYAFNRPGLKDRCKARLGKYPKLYARLRGLAQAHGLVPTHSANPATVDEPETKTEAIAQPIPEQPAPERLVPVSAAMVNDGATPPEVDLSILTPRARSIYRELVVSMSKRQKEVA